MGDVGDEFAAALFRLLQGIRHFIEGFDQRAHFVGGILGLLDADGEVAPGELAGGRGHLIQRPGHTAGIDHGERQGDAEHHHGDQHRNGKEGGPGAQHIIGHIVDKHIADERPLGIPDRLRRHIAAHRENAAQIAAPVQKTAFRLSKDLTGDLKTDVLALGVLVRAAANNAFLIGDEDLVSRGGGHRADVHAQRPAIQGILAGHRAGDVGDLLGAAIHVFAVLTDHILPAHAHEGQSHQQKADRDQGGDGNKVAQINAFHPFSPLSSSNL